MPTLEQLEPLVIGRWRGEGTYGKHPFTQEDHYQRINNGAFIKCQSSVIVEGKTMPTTGIYAQNVEQPGPLLFWFFSADGSYGTADVTVEKDRIIWEGNTKGGSIAGPWRSVLEFKSDDEAEFRFFTGDAGGDLKELFRYTTRRVER